MNPRPIQRSEHLDEVGDLFAPIGSHEWAVAVRLWIQSLIRDAESNAVHLRNATSLMEEHAGYQALNGPDGEPFTSYESFCTARVPWGLGYEPDALQRIIHERESAQARARDAKPLAQHGEIGRGRDRVDNVNSIEGGNSADYLTARIARDRPDILERMKAGEYPSVRAAAREAGIVKGRVSVERTPRGFARAIKRHLSDDDIDELIDLLGG